MPYVLAIPTSQRLWADTENGPAQPGEEPARYPHPQRRGEQPARAAHRQVVPA